MSNHQTPQNPTPDPGDDEFDAVTTPLQDEAVFSEEAPEVSPEQQQIADLTLALQRERADAMNQRRHHDAQTANLKNIIKATVIRDLLPVIDNFERSLKHVPADLEGNDYIKGVQGVVKQFEQTLEKLGVQRIKTVDQPFDPRFHEAISMEEGDGDQETVSEELQSGYTLGEEVIRHAMVRVTLR